jgi:hypothetical protein
MMKLIRKMFSISTVRPKVIILRESKTEWTLHDAKTWKTFCESETGRKVLVIAEDLAITNRTKISVGTTADLICHSAGIADGMALMVNYLKSLYPANAGIGGGDENNSEFDGDLSE